MPHLAAVIKKVKRSDGEIAVTIRCDNDPSTDSVHTIGNLSVLSTQAVLALIDLHKANTEIKHAAMLRADEVLSALE